MNQELIETAKSWAANAYFDNASRNEIQELLDRENYKEIEERFYKDLEFGTGGMRAILGMGPNRISKYSVRKATQAMALAIKEYYPDENASVAISYDSRKYSDEFAKEVCCVFAGNGIKAYIYDRLNPVCLLSWSIRYHKSKAGVMITASHNPPEYNGYKAFWADGAQVTPPYDQTIIDAYNNISDFGQIQYLDFEEGIKNELIEWVGKEVEDAYYKMLKEKTCLNPKMCEEKGKELSIVYTAIHGTGLIPCTRILNDYGLTNYHIVKEQAEPDSRFPTVTSPNPEDASAMAMALKLMQEKNADVAYGTDPDTDRLGVIVNNRGNEVFLNGNEIGTLMLHYVFSTLQQQGKLDKNSYIVKTIVTTKLHEDIAAKFGVRVENTLTGFKWICKRIKELEKSNPELKFLFGTEESFGYMSHDNVRDKDGVNALALMSEVALHHKLNDKTLVEALDDIYKEYGFFKESLLSLNYYGKEGAEKIARIMSYFRANVTTSFADEEIAFIEDYQELVRKGADGSTSKLDVVKSNVLGLEFKSGNFLYLRPSGTEPKIKFYTMIRVNEGNLEEKKEAAKKKIDFLTEKLKEVCETI